jgi:ketosteroid isomerase-like protein
VALNARDWNRLLAQYPDDAQINLPTGTIVKGRQAIGEMFAGFCKDSKDGGLKRLRGGTQRADWGRVRDAVGRVGTVPRGTLPRL